MIEEIKEKLNNVDIQKFQEQKDYLSEKTNAISDYNSTESISLYKELTKTNEILALYAEITTLVKQLEGNSDLLNDPDFGDDARIENAEIEKKLGELTAKFELYTATPLENDEKKAIFEIRPGVGGIEASLFAEELYKVYIKYCAAQKYNIEILSLEQKQEGGINEAIFLVDEPGSYATFRFESGVHRVQRVPKTEAMGRIHTSTVTVAVLPQFEYKDVSINPNDIRIDVYRSSGPGGQSVNTTDSAVRILHIPTGIIVTSQQGKSQHKNKDLAMSVLASKLEELEREKRQKEAKDIKSEAVADSERSSKIRTFNFPQSRITDHRIHKSWFNIEEVMEGLIEDIIVETQKGIRGGKVEEISEDEE
jgi:peptide chain release factor 1